MNEAEVIQLIAALVDALESKLYPELSTRTDEECNAVNQRAIEWLLAHQSKSDDIDNVNLRG